MAQESEKQVRILIAQPGLDGRDRGAEIIARELRSVGMFVVHNGLRQTPEMIAEAAHTDKVDLVHLSILSGEHLKLVPRVRAALDQLNLNEVALIVGGIIPHTDHEHLLERGADAVFGPEAEIEEIRERVYSRALHKESINEAEPPSET